MADLAEHTSPLVTPFGANLEPVLRHCCDDRLTNLTWFRTAWQRGGALTGYGQYLDDGGEAKPVVVKLPVPPREINWLERLQTDGQDPSPLVPRLFAAGRLLGGYDLAWVVMERLGHGPLDSTWGGVEFDLLVDAVTRFHAAAARHEVDQPPRNEDWPDVLKRARQAIHDHHPPHEQQWNAAIKAIQKKLPHMLEVWDARPIDGWCHGDAHLANAMTRAPAPAGPAVLFDLALVHAGHWVEDAVYFEHLFWAAPGRLDGRKIVKLFAAARKSHGLTVEAHYPDLAKIRRCLLAAAAPLHLNRPGDSAHIQAALHILEQTVPGVK